MVKGKKRTNKEFNKLSYKEQILCKKNRITAKKSIDNSKEQIFILEKENSNLIVYIELLEKIIHIISNNQNNYYFQYINDKSYREPICPKLKYRSILNIEDKRERNRIYAHNSKIRIKNKIYQVQIMNSILKERKNLLEQYIDNLN